MASSLNVTIKDAEPATVAYVRKKGSYAQVGAAFGQLYHWMTDKGFIPSGPPSGVYFNSPAEVPEDQLIWELRSPVSVSTQISGPDKEGLGVKKEPGAKVAATMHRGPYDTVGRTYQALAGWIAENGYEIAGPPEEVYFTDPAKTPPPELLTEVRFPVRKR